MTAATTDQLLVGERAIRDDAASPFGRSTLIEFLRAQVEAREMKPGITST